MLNPADIVAAVVDTLRDIPDLVDRLGHPESIFAYSDQYPAQKTVEDAVTEMMTPSIMVVHESTEMGAMGEVPRWQHNIVLYIRAEGQAGESGYYELINIMANGHPASNPCHSFLESQLHPECDGPADPEFSRYATEDGIDLWQLKFSLTELGS
jgi:hypothetical protein